MSALSFNSSNWYEPKDVFIMATDDDIILESPYGAVVSLFSVSDRLSYNNNNTFTLVIADSDVGKQFDWRAYIYFLQMRYMYNNMC